MNVDDGNQEGQENDRGKRHAFLHLYIFEAIKGRVGDHGESSEQTQHEHDPRHFTARDAVIIDHPNEARENGRCRGRRQTLKITPVHHLCKKYGLN